MEVCDSPGDWAVADVAVPNGGVGAAHQNEDLRGCRWCVWFGVVWFGGVVGVGWGRGVLERVAVGYRCLGSNGGV